MNTANIWRRQSIRSKLLTAYLFVALLPILLLGFSSYSIARKSAQQEAMAVILQSQQQMLASIEQNCDRMESVLNLLGANEDLLRFAEGSFANPYDEYNIANRMQRTIQSMLVGMGGSSAFTMICYAADAHEIVVQDFEGKMMIDSASVGQLNPEGTHRIAIYNAKRYDSDEWFQSEKNIGTAMKWLQVEQDKKYGNISLLKQMRMTDVYGQPVGLAKLTVRLKDIYSAVPENVVPGGYAYFLVDSSGNVLGTADNIDVWKTVYDKFGKSLNNLAYNTPMIIGETVLVKSSTKQGWYVLGAYTMHFFREKLARITEQVILFAAIAVLLVAVVSIFVARSFALRICRVTADMKRFRMGQHSMRTKVVGNDEVSGLAMGFNEMAGQIERLINDVYKAELTIQQEHLSMLQSQINPHFLYNSLSAIIRLSERGKQEIIKEMTLALVRFYRLSLSHGQALIPLVDEIEHVKSYIDVFRIRRGDDFSVDFDIGEEALSCKVPKVILQPFVENAIEHGLSPERGMMHITVSAHVEEDGLVCRIADDGIGMSPEVLRSVSSDASPAGTGYGIKNVDERIRAYFGMKWGVSIASSLETGTVVTISMPPR